MIILIIIHGMFSSPSPSLVLAPFMSLQNKSTLCYNKLEGQKTVMLRQEEGMRPSQDMKAGPKQRCFQTKLVALHKCKMHVVSPQEFW